MKNGIIRVIYSVCFFMLINVCDCSEVGSSAASDDDIKFKENEKKGNDRGAMQLPSFCQEKNIRTALKKLFLEGNLKESPWYALLKDMLKQDGVDHSYKPLNVNESLNNQNRVESVLNILREIHRVCSEAAGKLAVWAASCPAIVPASEEIKSLKGEEFSIVQSNFRKLAADFSGEPLRLITEIDENNSAYKLRDLKIDDSTDDSAILEKIGFIKKDSEELSLSGLMEGCREIADYLRSLYEVVNCYKELIAGENEERKNRLRNAVDRLKTIKLKPVVFSLELEVPDKDKTELAIDDSSLIEYEEEDVNNEQNSVGDDLELATSEGASRSLNGLTDAAPEPIEIENQTTYAMNPEELKNANVKIARFIVYGIIQQFLIGLDGYKLPSENNKTFLDKMLNDMNVYKSILNELLGMLSNKTNTVLIKSVREKNSTSKKQKIYYVNFCICLQLLTKIMQ